MLTALEPLAVPELSTGTLLAYIAFLALSGVILLILGALPLGSSKNRIINALIGVAMLGYAGYILLLTGPNDTIVIFYYVFIVPILAIIQTVKAVKAKSEAKASAAYQQQFSAPPAADPQHGYATPQPGYAPQEGYAAPQPGYAAPQQGYAAPEQGYAPPQPGQAPQPPA